MLGEYIKSYGEDPEKLTIHVWYCITFLVIILCMTFIGAAAENNVTTEETTDGFICIWSMFIFAAVTAYGYFAMMKWEEEFSLGCFMGLCTMAAQYTLILFAHFANASKTVDTDGDSVVAAFSFIVCVFYVYFTYLLIRNRKYFIASLKNSENTNTNGEEENPPSQDQTSQSFPGGNNMNYEQGHVTTAPPPTQEQQDIVEKENAFNHAQV